MEDQLITFETAKLAKEKGFYIDCRDGYRVDEEGYEHFKKDWWLHLSDHYEKHLKESDFLYGSPTQSLLQKWLREKYDIDVLIFKMVRYEDQSPIIPRKKVAIDSFKEYQWSVNGAINWTNTNGYSSYEEALEEGLKQTLTHLNTQ